MKVFLTNYDGRRYALVAANSQRVAAKLIGTSLYDFQKYSSVSSNQLDTDTAMADVGSVFLAEMKYGSPWVKRIDRTPSP